MIGGFATVKPETNVVSHKCDLVLGGNDLKFESMIINWI